MKKKLLVLASLLFLFFLNNKTYGQAKIKAYFNHPVDTTVSSGVNAVYLASGTMADTICNYILRAKYTIDIAQYDYNQNSSGGGAYASIAAAVDTAYARGVTVRWIYDGSSSNGGLSLLDTGIHTLGSPTSSSYGIMHNKFILIDANSSDPNDPIVWMGSPDWSAEMFHSDYNNCLFIQDSALASAYTLEFNMMWGGTTAVPNPTASKFGTYKTDIGIHTFTIAGHQVELYFSPTDNPDSHIASTILTANRDLYVGVYDMTRTGDASNIVSRKNSGVYTLAVVDQYTPATSSSVNSILSTGLGSDYTVYSGFYIYHNKMMVVDPSDTCSDPIVETGSENWTSSGTNSNDENILIIHNDTLANIYYQSIVEDYKTISGNSWVAHFSGPCGETSTEGVQATSNKETTVAVYPDPASSEFTISYDLASEAKCHVSVYNMLGQEVMVLTNNEQQAAGSHSIECSNLKAGMYFVSFVLGSETFEKKVVVTGN